MNKYREEVLNREGKVGGENENRGKGKGKGKGKRRKKNEDEFKLTGFI